MQRVLSYLLGIVVVAIAALVAHWLGSQLGLPIIAIGLLIGFAWSFAATTAATHTDSDSGFAAGLGLCSQTFLRIAIVLFGLRISFAEIAGLGWLTFLVLFIIMVLVIIAGLGTVRLLGQDRLYGLLVGGATAICGISAALAIWSVLGKERMREAQLSVALVGIVVASALAMLSYPSLAGLLELSDRQAGFFLGASIHDVAQAIGGGFAYSAGAGEVSIIVKLSRVTMLAPVLIITAVLLQREREMESESASAAASAPSPHSPHSLDSPSHTIQTPSYAKILRKQGLPWYIIGFALVVLVGNLVALPAFVIEHGSALARNLLLCAIIATAMRANIADVRAHGWQAFVPIVVATFVAFILSLAASLYLPF